MSKTAFITGITGMDGKLLSNFLLGKGYKIIGLVRKQSVHNIIENQNIDYIIGDLTQMELVLEKIKEKHIDEFYLLGAQSSIEPSWVDFNYTYETNVTSLVKTLEFIRLKSPHSKLFYASSSEIFGNPTIQPQTESTEKLPRNPYGVSKLLSQEIIGLYRNLFKVYSCSGVLYNHESEYRNRDVVTKKITSGVAKISLGLENKIILGNLESRRDWTSAKDFIEAMWIILQQEHPDDYILSSGTIRTVKEMVKVAFEIVGISDWENYVETTETLYRPSESIDLVGNNNKIKSTGWEPKIPFDFMIKEMIDFEIEKLKK